MILDRTVELYTPASPRALRAHRALAFVVADQNLAMPDATAGSNFSFRGARLEFAPRFVSAIHDYRGVCELHDLSSVPVDSTNSFLSQLPELCVRRIARFLVGSYKQAEALTSIAQPLRPPAAGAFEIVVRKRPLWAAEAERGEFDALTIDERAGRCVVHDGKAAKDMSTYTLHREYALDHCFGAEAQEDEIHSTVVDPLVARVVAGGRSSLVLFGQTGTGKTHTAHAMQRHLARQLFGSSAGIDVELEVFELRQKKAFDLLNERQVVRLVTDAEEQVHVLRGTKALATTEAELLQLIDRAHALRSVAATERNAQSSRSHAVCRMRVSVRGAEGAAGCFTLVDLAGSERNDDTSKHDRASTMESADINTSLQTLKECFRATFNKDVDLETFVEVDADDVEWTRAVPKGSAAAAAFKAAQEKGKAAQGLKTMLAKREEGGEAAGSGGGAAPAGGGGDEGLKFDPKLPAALRNFAHEGGRKLHMPYRRHQLTLLMKDCFVNPDHRTVVVACVSPTATDVEHSWRTLHQVCQMRGAEADVCRETRVVCARTTTEAADVLPFRKWPPARVREWLSAMDDAELVGAAGTLPAAVDGKELLRWPPSRLAHQCFDGDHAAAERMYKAVRDESARVDEAAAGKRGRVRGLAGRVDRYKTPAAAEAEVAAAEEEEEDAEDAEAAADAALGAEGASPAGMKQKAVMDVDGNAENVERN